MTPGVFIPAHVDALIVPELADGIFVAGSISLAISDGISGCALEKGGVTSVKRCSLQLTPSFAKLPQDLP